MGTFQKRQYDELAAHMASTLAWYDQFPELHQLEIKQIQHVFRVLVSYLRQDNDNMNVDLFYEQSGIKQ